MLNIECIKLSAENLILLLEKKQLPISNLSFKRNLYYAFYHKDILYGIYLLKASGRYHYFKKNHYQPIKLIGSKNHIDRFLKDSNFLLNTWKKRSSLQKKIFLFYKEDKRAFYLEIIANHLDNLKILWKIEKTPDLLSTIEKILNLFNSKENQELTILKRLGEKLYRLTNFAKIEKKLTNAIIRIHSDIPNPTNLNSDSSNLIKAMSALYNGKDFPILKSQIIFHHDRSKNYHNQNYIVKINCFALLTSHEDDFMKLEKTMIKKVFDNKKNFQSHFMICDQTSSFVNPLESVDFAHLIFHGENKKNQFQFLNNGQSIFSSSQVSSLARSPKVLFLSTCHSDHPQLIEEFLNHGTQTVIVCQGNLFSSNLGQVMESFYRYLLFEKLNVLTAFQLMVTKLHQLDDINAVKLRIYGWGKEQLWSNK